MDSYLFYNKLARFIHGKTKMCKASKLTCPNPKQRSRLVVGERVGAAVSVVEGSERNVRGSRGQVIETLLRGKL